MFRVPSISIDIQNSTHNRHADSSFQRLQLKMTSDVFSSSFPLVWRKQQKIKRELLNKKRRNWKFAISKLWQRQRFHKPMIAHAGQLFCGRRHCLSTGHHTWGLLLSPWWQVGTPINPSSCNRDLWWLWAWKYFPVAIIQHNSETTAFWLFVGAGIWKDSRWFKSSKHAFLRSKAVRSASWWCAIAIMQP